MSAYKQFLTSDVIVTPFEVNKGFYYAGAENLTGSDGGVDRFLGKNISSSLWVPGLNPSTGQISTLDQELVYKSIKDIYYGNYQEALHGNIPATASVISGSNPSGDVWSGSINPAGYFAEYFNTTLGYERWFPTGSNDTVGVISIPSRLFGNYIVPKSFNIICESGSIYDDGEGNLILSSSGKICGNIFYYHGMAIITSDGVPGQDAYGDGVYGSATYGVSDASFIEAFVTSSNVTCSFSSSLEIYETQYKCTLRESEFNYTMNPSINSGSSTGQMYDFVTGSYFGPYISTVGLYNESYELIAVGKLSQPIPSSPTTDTTILINLDLL
jgi:hypothetical protein